MQPRDAAQLQLQPQYFSATASVLLRYSLSTVQLQPQYCSAAMSASSAVQPVKGWLLMPAPPPSSYCSYR